MTQVRLLAPWTNDKGEPQAAGAVIDVDEETAIALSNRGMVSRLDDEKALEEQQITSGVYDARVSRAKAPNPTEAKAPTPTEAPSPKRTSSG